MKISTKNENKRIITASRVGIFSASLLAASSAIYLYSPVIGTHAATIDADFNVAVNDNLSLTLDKSELRLSSSVNSFVSGNVSATVVTNSQYGYTLALENKDDSSNLVHADENVSDVITSSFEGSKTSSTMDTNTWGYSINSTDYYSVPVYGSPVSLFRKYSPTVNGGVATLVDFGVKAGNLTSGTYSDQVVFTAYVNGQDDVPDDQGGGQADYNENAMQKFECRILENVGDTMELEDARDGNTYNVMKLKDGNCWMTENLRIAGKTITSADSNLPDGETYNIPESDLDSFTMDDTVASVYVDEENGGYYTFPAATAGWGGTSAATNGVNSPRDICPKGWRLPTGGNSINGRPDPDFWNLYLEYYKVPYLQEVGFTLSGYVFVNPMVRDVGRSGRFWSSTANSSISGHYFEIGRYENDIWSTTYGSNTEGHSIRCISKN